MKITPVILSGGSGTRLWPMSRKDYPKQFLALLDNYTMLQETVIRIKNFENLENPIIICHEDHRFLVAEQCKKIGLNNPTILLEPISRNTAPAITAAAILAIQKNKHANLLVLSADHLIKDSKEFQKSIKKAQKHIKVNKLVTFGIVPGDPNIGYGYIKKSSSSNYGAFNVIKFIEKPDLEKAKLYLKQSDYLWNSGIFMFKAETFINELNLYFPDIVELIGQAVKSLIQDLDFIRLGKKSYEKCINISIDYALLEKTKKIVVIPLNSEWNDVGTWSALYDISNKDKNGNVLKGDIICKNTTNSLIHGNDKLLVTIGVENLIIVDTSDAILVTKYDQSQNIKEIINMMEKNGRLELKNHTKVYRPWGWFDSLETGKNFQVKKLHINPGERLSLQFHNKRAEHWVVISGTGTVTNGEKIFNLTKGESTYIPIKRIHSLENKTQENLEIIEVQIGNYLGEDDIVRINDIYNRI